MATIEAQPRVIRLPAELGIELRNASWQSGMSISAMMREKVHEFLHDPSIVEEWPDDPGTGQDSAVRLGLKFEDGMWDALREKARVNRMYPTTVVRRAGAQIVEDGA